MGPFIPLGIIAMELYKKIKSFFDPDEWFSGGAGAVFFVKPPSKLGDFLWSCYLNQSMYVGQYLLAGTNDDAI